RKANTFKQLSAPERYKQLDQFSDAVNRDMKEEVLKGLEGQTDPVAAAQRKEIRARIYLGDRYRALASKPMEQWAKRGTEASPPNIETPPPNVEESLRLLRSNTIHQYMTLDSLSKGEGLEGQSLISEGSQSKSLSERLSEVGDKEQKRRIIFKYYEEK